MASSREAEERSVPHHMNRLTKTTYVEGLDCDRRLWLNAHKREAKTPPDAAVQRLFQQGQEVDHAAREQFPDGVTMPHHFRRTEEALAATAVAIKAGERCLFQAAFEHDGVLIVADILERIEDGWHLVEVKMTSEVKPEHLNDLAVQRYVLEEVGLKVRRASIMHINTESVHPDTVNLFLLEDVTARLGEAHDVRTTLERYRRILAEEAQPDVQLGRHCLNPVCPDKAHCWAGLQGRTIYDLQDLHHSTQKKLAQQQVLLIDEIPEDFILSDRAAAGLARYKTNGVDIDYAEIAAQMGTLEYPLAFLDFETDNPPLPNHVGTQPFQQVPFQYSLHVLHRDGTLEHHEYLHVEATDPRASLVTDLLDHMPTSGSVIAYSAGFEKRVLSELADAFPEQADDLRGIVERMRDQLDIVRKAYRHHAFGASNSLKAVLPVLVPHLSYGSLSVRNGTQAQVAFEQIVRRVEGWEALADDLRAYCHLDTLAMVELHRHFEGVLP